MNVIKKHVGLNFSAREKILLLILGCVIFWFLIAKLVILPNLANKSVVEVELMDLETQKQQIVLYVNEYDDIENKLQEEYNNLYSSDYFYRNIDDVFVGKTVLSLAKKYNLTVSSNIIANPAETAVSEYYTNLKVMLYPIKEQRFTFDKNSYSNFLDQISDLPPVKDDKETEEKKEDNGQLIPMYSDTIFVVGNVDNVMKMVDEINSMDKSVYVSTIGTSQAYNIVNGDFMDEITINFYYLDD